MKRRVVVTAALLIAGLLGLSATVEAGRRPTPGLDVTVVAGFGSVTYDHQAFYGGELAMVKITGDGSTVLKVVIYDEYGNLIDSDIGYTCVAVWYPKWTGVFTMEVHNLGGTSNLYKLETN